MQSINCFNSNIVVVVVVIVEILAIRRKIMRIKAIKVKMKLKFKINFSKVMDQDLLETLKDLKGSLLIFLERRIKRNL